MKNLENLIEERLRKINPKRYEIEGLKEVASFIRNNRNRHFFVIGDYDVDGVMATSIVMKILNWLRIDGEFYIPHRFTDGYGANPKIIEKVSNNSVVILVDNGIVAFDAVNAAKEKGCSIIILDHHLKADTGELPAADFLIDPNAVDQCEFVDYCGAGLAYKLAEAIDYPRMDEISVLAAYATIADCVSLTGENWLIAQSLNKIDKNIGLKALCSVMGDEMHDENAAGFKICPAINAAGRLLDNGATHSVNLMLCRDTEQALNLAKYSKQLNEERKMLVEYSLRRAEKVLGNFDSSNKKSIVIIVPKVPEGIVGIVAGKLAEKYNVPTVVCSRLENGFIKGSARSEGERNHLKNILDGCKDLLLKYGGHKAAAGLTLSEGNFEDFKERFDSLCLKENVKSDNAEVIEMDISDIEEILDILSKAAPYGQDNPRIVFKTKTTLRENKPFSMVGKYLKLIDKDNIDIMCFDDLPDTGNILGGEDISIIGYPSANVFRKKPVYQMEALNIKFV